MNDDRTPPSGPRVLTVGHSTRSLEELLDVLRAHHVGLLVDVRRWPASRRMPHFGKDQLEDSLRAAGMDYLHEPALGGYRKPLPASPNGAWEVEAFRGYADHLATDEARAAVSLVVTLAREQEASGRFLAACCAEALPERCHRRILADALVARGARVLHVIDASRSRPHEPPAFARFDGDAVTYPPERGLFDG